MHLLPENAHRKESIRVGSVTFCYGLLKAELLAHRVQSPHL